MTHFNPYDNRITFDLLTKEEKEILKANSHWEYRNYYGNWTPVEDTPIWAGGVIYRSVKKEIKPTVCWEYFSHTVKAVAWDKTGEGYAYPSIPIIDDHCEEWQLTRSGNVANISLFPPNAATRGNREWYESIIIREES